MDEFEFFFCQFPNPWALRVSGMGGYTSKCEKSQNHCTLIYSLDNYSQLLATNGDNFRIADKKPLKVDGNEKLGGSKRRQ